MPPLVFTSPGVRMPSWSHPVIAAGRLYICASQDTLHVYNIRMSQFPEFRGSGLVG